MRSINQEKGMTAIGWLMVLALIGFFVLVTLRMLPSYLDYYRVTSVLSSLEGQKNIAQKPVAEIRKLIERGFDVNDVSGVKPAEIRIKQEGGGLTVTADYEKRVHLAGNVDVVMKFNKVVKVGGR